MTIQQFHREFKISFDKIDSEAYPELQDGEIDFYLNEAQDRFIKQRYGINNLYRAGFEEKQKRIDDLKEIVISRYSSITPVQYYLDTNRQVYEADLSSLFSDSDLDTATTEEYMFFVKALVETCIGECCNWSKVEYVQQDDLSTIQRDPFNKPTIVNPVMFFENGNIFIETESTGTINNILVTFIKRPNQVNIGTYGGTVTECELSEHTHKEILQMAVGIALENIESPRQQSQEVLNVQKVE